MSNKAITYDISEGWPCGISDGLRLGCSDCGEHTDFDYTVSDELWNSVVPEGMKRGVVCLSCLDKLAKAHGMYVSEHLEQVQYTGIEETVVLKPEIAFRYNKHEVEGINEDGDAFVYERGKWYGWTGGRNPVPGKYVKVIFGDGTETEEIYESSRYRWSHINRIGDILKFMVV